MRYSDIQRLEHISATARKLLAWLSDQAVTREEILSREPLRWTITTPLYNIGEHCSGLSDAFKAAHPDIPWSKVAGLRHRLVHDYENTNWTLICTILFDVLPGFVKDVDALIEQVR